MLLLKRIITIVILIKLNLNIARVVIGRQPHQISHIPHIGREARHPHVGHIPFKTCGGEQGIVYCRIIVELAGLGGLEWREFRQSVTGGYRRLFGAGGALYVMVSLRNMLAAEYR